MNSHNITVLSRTEALNVGNFIVELTHGQEE